MEGNGSTYGTRKNISPKIEFDFSMFSANMVRGKVSDKILSLIKEFNSVPAVIPSEDELILMRSPSFRKELIREQIKLLNEILIG